MGLTKAGPEELVYKVVKFAVFLVTCTNKISNCKAL